MSERFNSPGVFWPGASAGHRSHTPEAGQTGQEVSEEFEYSGNKCIQHDRQMGISGAFSTIIFFVFCL